MLRRNIRRKKIGKPGRAAGVPIVHLNGSKNQAEGQDAKYFKHCPWDKWWQEFHTSRQTDGRLTYPTAWSFAKRKGLTTHQKSLIFSCIGPKPIERPLSAYKKKHKRLPFLGDWQVERAKAYFYDNESVEKMKKVVTERMDGLEAGRGGATVILDLLARWTKYDAQIDDAFNFTNMSLSDTAKEKMVDRFLKLKNKTRRGIQDLVSAYLQCHGITPDGGMNDLGALVMAVSQASAKGTIAGMAAGNALAGGVPISDAASLIAHAIQDKAQTFRMPLPSILVEAKEAKE